MYGARGMPVRGHARAACRANGWSSIPDGCARHTHTRPTQSDAGTDGDSNTIPHLGEAGRTLYERL